MNSDNPYAPPAAIGQHIEPYQDGLVWRQGELLCIANGAALPQRCFVTGQDTEHAIDVKQYWQPGWVYLLALACIVPYLIASPLMGRYVELRVPMSRELIRRHIRTCNLGFRLLLSGVLIGVGGLAMSVWGTRALVSLPIWLSAAVLLVAVGIILASRSPLRLGIVDLQAGVLKLSGVHPRCLEGLPSQPDEHGGAGLPPA